MICAVVDDDRRLDRALVGGRAGVVGADRGAGRDRRRLLVDRHAHRAVLADLRLDPQRDADVLALDGLERVGRGGAGVGELAGDERHVLADDDARLLVVERHQVRRRQDVGVGLGRARRARCAARPKPLAPPKLRIEADVAAGAEPRQRPRCAVGRALVREDVAGPVPKLVPAPPMLRVALVAERLPLDAEVGASGSGRPRRSATRCRPARGASRAGRSPRAAGGTAARAP